jgi:type II secretory ATPase GspE/PulE/Tfp pilus assembly ATPase PilB-like protein
VASAKSSIELNLVRATQANSAIPNERLTPEQLKIINHSGSRLLVLGQAGSGKTTTLIAAIAHRISQGVNPNAILATLLCTQWLNQLLEPFTQLHL